MGNILKIQEKIYVLRNVILYIWFVYIGGIYKMFVIFFIPPLFGGWILGSKQAFVIFNKIVRQRRSGAAEK